MKNTLKILFAVVAIAFVQQSEAQIWKKIKKRAEKKVEQKVLKETDKKIDKVLNPKQAEEKRKKDSITAAKNPKKGTTKPSQNQNENPKEGEEKIGFWMSYDFIPGKEVIFFDNMQEEDYGDFPRRWDLLGGNAEVGRFGKEKVLLFYNTNTVINPLFKEEKYLPDAFSIEFDIYFDEVAQNNRSEYKLYFNDDLYNPIEIKSYFPFEVTYKAFKHSTSQYKNIRDFNGWHHIAISYHKGYLKMYFDEQKVLNIPRLDFVPEKLNKIKVYYSESSKQKRVLSIKNFKLAKGGGKPYAQVIADGKFVTHGILFDTGKATLKAQSAGVLKRVTDMLLDNPDWKFEIVGHTDSDGDDESNLVLSQKRAEAVKQALLDRDIDAMRLTTSGKGEAEALNGNSTPEEKANNRRVEFILKK
ncbi:OmpA family protein [Spongiivirga citrea]|uniref:OmpA family protein n=1 Tax=Spongiivirga citrea TaxID=1481457 RepID=A0A6M0CDJ8_9FLAO|nr:OmpA family protein [Spongiivirga citrea]NER15876.1 OmpA family protein [Spongiivirga citrea]